MVYFRSKLPKGMVQSRFLDYQVYHLYDEDLFRHIKQGNYEKKNVDIVRELCVDGCVGFDIGANIGLFSLQVLNQRTHENIVIHAFEANPITFSRLQMTVQYNNLSDRIKTYPFALSNLQNLEYFALHQARSCSGDGFFDTGRAGATNSIVVQTTTIDGFVSKTGFNRLDWMKIDIEGAEFLALCGASETMTKFRPKILLEINKLNIKPYQTSLEELYDLLMQFDYEVCDTSYRKLDLQSLNQRVYHEIGDDNYLAIPK